MKRKTGGDCWCYGAAPRVALPGGKAWVSSGIAVAAGDFTPSRLQGPGPHLLLGSGTLLPLWSVPMQYSQGIFCVNLNLPHLHSSL